MGKTHASVPNSATNAAALGNVRLIATSYMTALKIESGRLKSTHHSPYLSYPDDRCYPESSPIAQTVQRLRAEEEDTKFPASVSKFQNKREMCEVKRRPLR